MIPKVIHYCWFGRNPKPKLIKTCMKSWRKYCREYKIIEWNEDNFDIEHAPLYVRQAYETKNWAFVSDYVRLYVVYNHGGIYLDTDVELVAHIDDLLHYDGFFGVESSVAEHSYFVNTGQGFGAVKSLQLLKSLMLDYENRSFIQDDGKNDFTACPAINTHVFIDYGFSMDNSLQIINGIALLPTGVFSTGISPLQAQSDTIFIHHYQGSWTHQWGTKETRDSIRKEHKKEIYKDIAQHPIKYFFKWVLGKEKYYKIKKLVSKNK